MSFPASPLIVSELLVPPIRSAPAVPSKMAIGYGPNVKVAWVTHGKQENADKDQLV
jgi:hypothetical protein